MNTKILSKDKDPMGAAILDYQKSGRAGRLRVLSSMFEEDEMPVKHLFRKVEEMPMLEQKALQLTKGRVLDIGAGSGCHSLCFVFCHSLIFLFCYSFTKGNNISIVIFPFHLGWRDRENVNVTIYVIYFVFKLTFQFFL